MTLQCEVLEGVSKLRYPPEVIEDWESIADILSDKFPWKGSKIDWKLLAHHIEGYFNFSSEILTEEIRIFLDKSGANNSIEKSDVIYYINDSSLDLAFSLKPDSFLEFAEYAIKNIPQHHYFFDDNGRWCLAITSEGYIDFGFAV
ncbi:type IV secretion protein Rhs [Erwiniaceae bacterium L1_54_6]|jgi:hypothetical protein|nr:type IV secretion protein Rhs [Erwiniaceae bacterium L1_54_6]